MTNNNNDDKQLKDFLPKLDGDSYFEEFTNFNSELRLEKSEIIRAIREVYDPEIPVNIYDLGLVYDIDISGEYDVSILMTLTAPNCPVAGEMPKMVANAVKKLEGYKSIRISLVWEPPWSKDMMSEDAKLALDIS